MGLAAHTAAEQSKRETRQRITEQATYALPGAALAAHVRRAVTAAAAKSPHRASEWELDALCSVVALSALRGGSLKPRPSGWRTRPSRAADVLAWIDYAERYPVSARRADEQRLTRGAGTRAHLERVTADRLADSRAWRDTASGYRTRALGVALTADTDTDLTERPSGGWLAAERDDCELPAASAELAEQVAESLGGTERERRAMALALRAALPTPEGEPQNLVALGAELGVSHGTARNLASDGARLLQAREPSGAALAELVRDTAERMRLAPPSRALRALVTGQPAPLYPSAMLAAWAVERLAPPAQHRSERSVPEREPRLVAEPVPLGRPYIGRTLGHPHVSQPRTGQPITAEPTDRSPCDQWTVSLRRDWRSAPPALGELPACPSGTAYRPPVSRAAALRGMAEHVSSTTDRRSR